MLPEPIELGEVTMTLLGRQPQTITWITDDSGRLLRMGRGLPSVRFIKGVLSRSSLTFRSSMEGMDALTFDVSNLAEQVKPLRASCRW